MKDYRISTALSIKSDENLTLLFGNARVLIVAQTKAVLACGFIARLAVRREATQMSKQKTKGDNYERELAAYINSLTGLTTALRAPLSGGGAIGVLSGGADLMGVPNLFIEAKRVERLNFHDAMRQAEKNIDKTKSPDIPIVINRKNRMPTGQSLCLLRLDDLLFFYRYYLRCEGYVEEDEPDDSKPTDSADK